MTDGLNNFYQGYDEGHAPLFIIKAEVRRLILKTVKNNLLDIRAKLTEDGTIIALAEGEKLEFAAEIRTKTVIDDDETDGIKEVVIESNQYDADGRIVFQTDLAEVNACPGTYRFEINIILANGRRYNLSPKEDNMLIIRD